ncbi:efflux RND transporter periplasmic adaptor subunit [Staphylococcus ureilyticus]|uniref:efflux RND transporter periplasmic adaptor subunit n=1 Tax=Staphylococcus ureilyticus TaxID=94138 RepID=UPI0021D00087|nr:efflux RND transporter periplasmic adaptor subunit [Staphylococcus ureilyticus]UXS60337.1 efflux RND transporter periplasmic adaptor subunit [Staphylococcus ureilyticus]
MKRIFIILATLLTLFSTIALSLWFYLKSQSSNFEKQIETIKVTYKKPPLLIGRQEPSQLVSINYNPSQGTVHDWFVKTESKVVQNQPLFEYYNPHIEQLITQKQKLLAQLTKTSKPTSTELINLKTEIAHLQSKLRTTIFSPISGTIIINPSRMFTQNLPFIQIYDPKPVIRAEISETEKNVLHIKDKVKITSDFTNNSFGTITHIAKLPINQKNLSKPSKYSLEISPNSDQFFGKHVKIEKSTTQIEIPRTAIGNGQFVYLLNNKKFIKRVIKSEKSGNKKTTLIIEGLKPGDIIAKNVDTVRPKN